MDEKLRLLVWIVGGGGFFGLLGTGFGALAGSMHWQAGRASGTALALRLALALLGPRKEEMSPALRGAVVGGVDGFLFLFVMGLILGAFGARTGVALTTAGVVVLSALLLVGGALFFGGLAYCLCRSEMPGVAGMFGGASVGGTLGYSLASATGLLVGVLGGATLGALGILAGQRFTPRKEPPQFTDRLEE